MGVRPISPSRWARMRSRRRTWSPACTGRRIVREELSMPAADGLTNPPGGVGGKLEPLPPVELLHGMDEPEIALLDEVEQRHIRRLVLLGDRHDQAQVGVDEGVVGTLPIAHQRPQVTALRRGDHRSRKLVTGVPAHLDGPGQIGLVVLREQRITTDLVKVQPDEILIRTLVAFLAHTTSRFVARPISPISTAATLRVCPSPGRLWSHRSRPPLSSLPGNGDRYSSAGLDCSR